MAESKSKQGKLVLGYWNIRGLGQLTRYLLEYTGLAYTEKRYQKVEEWFAGDKAKLDMTFPNLPYLIDGDLKLTESYAVNLYVIRKSGRNELLGISVLEETRVRQLIGVLEDGFRNILMLCFNQKFEEVKQAKYTAEILPFLERIEKSLASDGREWLAGKTLTFPDFMLYEITQYINGIFPAELKKFPRIQALASAFEEIDEIQNYMMSEEFIGAPFLAVGHGAKWTGLPNKNK